MKLKPLNLLLIDDDEDDYVIIRGLLSEIKIQQYQVEWVSSYNKALEKMAADTYDIVLVDYRLGENTGLSLLKEAIDTGVSAPFIMLTGKGDHKIDLEAMKLGAADYLVKDKIDVYTLERSIRYAIDRKYALNALKESEHKYRSIFEQSRDVIFIANREGYFIDINESALQLFGFAKKTLHELTIYDLFCEPEEKDRFKELVEERREITDFEATLVSHKGEKVYGLISLLLQNNSDDEDRFYQGIIHDMTLRKKAEQELVANEKHAVIGRIAQMIAHEVRNPLTNVGLALEQLRHELDTDSIDKDLSKTYFDIISRNAHRINQLITELLNSSKQGELAFKEYSIDSLVEESLELAVDRIKLKEIKVEKTYETSGKKVKIDPEKLKIALLNIVINAVEAMEPKKGVLSVRNEMKNDRCMIYIGDNGSGISKENLNKLFDPFYTGKSNGMGLGLTTTQSIVLNHKGTIEVESQPGKGTTFIIGLNAQIG